MSRWVLLYLLFLSPMAISQSMYVEYGRVIGVELVAYEQGRDGSAGALFGGLLGYLSGEGQSGSNKALRTLGGMALGSAIDRHGDPRYLHRYRIEVDKGETRTIVMARRNFHLGDCVALEKGRSANLRHVASVFCEQPVPEEYTQPHYDSATACEKAKQQVLEASTEEAIHKAALKMNVLCDD